MDTQAYLQHLADQETARFRGSRQPSVAVHPLTAAASARLDEFEPGSGWGGYDRREDAVVFSSDFVAGVDRETLRMALLHAVGARRYRRKLLHRGVDGLARATEDNGVAASSMLAGPPEEPFATGIGPRWLRRGAIRAGDRYCWRRLNWRQRSRLAGLMLEYGLPTAPSRLTRLVETG